MALASAVAALLTKLAAAASLGGEEGEAEDVDEDDIPRGDDAVEEGGDGSDDEESGGSDGGVKASIPQPAAAVRRAPFAAASAKRAVSATAPAAPRTRATVSNASRRIWREKLELLGADTAALDDGVGNPTPTLTCSAAGNPAAASLASTAPISPVLWRACVRALIAVNSSTECQTTLNALTPKNIW